MADPFNSPIVGINYKDPSYMLPYTVAATSVGDIDAASDATGVAYFTALANKGAIDTTNWVADTFKTILNVTSGRGLVLGYIGCTAGGASTHTVEFTVDRVVKTFVVSALASGERALITAITRMTSEYTTASSTLTAGGEVLEADKATFGGVNGPVYLPAWHGLYGVPMLEFGQSLLIRAKHSATVNNSTATAYSGVQYRLLLPT